MGFLSDEALRKMSFKKLGKMVRISKKASIYNADQIEIGDYSRIDDFCVISGKVTIGRNVHIAVFCNVAGGSEGVVFDDFSGLAYGSHVFSQSDDYTGAFLTNPTVPSEFTKVTRGKVYIGRHCIIGTNSLILPGVTLGEGCSVGALSMVTKSTDPWSIYFGIPAKRIKERKKDMLKLEAAYLEQETQT